MSGVLDSIVCVHHFVSANHRKCRLLRGTVRPFLRRRRRLVNVRLGSFGETSKKLSVICDSPGGMLVVGRRRKSRSCFVIVFISKISCRGFVGMATGNNLVF